MKAGGEDRVFPPGIGRIVGAIVAFTALALIGVLARFTTARDLDERSAVRDRAAAACAALATESAGLREVSNATAAFEDDRQLVLGVAARQVESALRTGATPPESVAHLAARCRAVYRP